MRRGDDDAVGEAAAGGAQAVGVDRAVGDQDREGYRRGGRVAVPRIDPHLNACGRQDLHGRLLGRAGQRVRVLADQERSVDALVAAVFDDRSRGGDDVGLVESRV